MEAAWLGNNVSDLQTLMLGNAQNYAIAHIDHEGELISSSRKREIADFGPEDMFDEDDSEQKSHYEVDDTFDYRRHLEAA